MYHQTILYDLLLTWIPLCTTDEDDPGIAIIYSSNDPNPKQRTARDIRDKIQNLIKE
jgi:hypothetical protein